MTIDIKKDDLPQKVTARDLGVYGANTGAEPEFTDARTGVRYSIDREANQSRVTVTLPPKSGFVCDADFSRKGDSAVTLQTGVRELQTWSPMNWLNSYMAGEPIKRQFYFNSTDVPQTLTLEANKAILGIDLDKAGGEYTTRLGALAGSSYTHDDASIAPAQASFTFSVNPIYKWLSGDTLIKQSIDTSPTRAAIALVTAKGSVDVREIAPEQSYTLAAGHDAYHGFSSDVSRSWGLRLREVPGNWWHGKSLTNLNLKNTFDAAHEGSPVRNFAVIDAEPVRAISAPAPTAAPA